MTKFKVGSLILNRLNSDEGEKVDCEGIIVRHWQTESMFGSGMCDNIDLYVTLDKSWPAQINIIDRLTNFKESNWELKK